MGRDICGQPSSIKKDKLQVFLTNSRVPAPLPSPQNGEIKMCLSLLNNGTIDAGIPIPLRHCGCARNLPLRLQTMLAMQWFYSKFINLN